MGQFQHANLAGFLIFLILPIVEAMRVVPSVFKAKREVIQVTVTVKPFRFGNIE
jgi:hypothetical protein